ncbi:MULTISPECIES: ribose-5-phosphate isomerase RpiA [Paenibacillus]|uniref:Ribose-5-phosphate isomerase A n=1 Tax=Paenibacillus illinoisensis TaxID=59845 RepID=A0A2W0C6H6_9BACL|nr:MULTISPECIES: ribose-5-phosphate isomerase RpiA [Paenibacillus]MBM6382632.1 ribose-5-phosphate isomerase RpiA [Paenibacillus sp.]PAD31993.1 ribose 5-phosphate isomerase A [Paenibacillus sp. 7523-1]PYY27956.1 Ribose-5-phosphate isomerase A [Paenibacillus illinoisensis]
MNLKKIAAERAAEYIQDGMKVGLGTGSTAYFAICRLGERVREGLQIQAVATSEASDKLAREWGIPIIPFDQIGRLDITIDGADEVDPDFNLIKGGGGALLREKIVAANSDKLIIVADGSKAVQQLGQFPLPVEVVPFASEWTFQALEKLGCRPEWRMNEDERYLTDNGNLIADCRMESIVNVAELNVQLNMLPGVVDNGLFVDMADTVILAKDDGSIDERHRS